jgi:hypothetical protein
MKIDGFHVRPKRIKVKGLPAIFAAAEVPLTAAALTAAGAFTPLGRTGFVYNQSAPHERTPVAGLYRLGCYCVVVKFNKPESSCFSTESVPKNIHTICLKAGFRKKSLYICFCSLVGQIPHEKLCHLNSPNCCSERRLPELGALDGKSHQMENRKLQTDFLMVPQTQVVLKSPGKTYEELPDL